MGGCMRGRLIGWVLLSGCIEAKYAPQTTAERHSGADDSASDDLPADSAAVTLRGTWSSPSTLAFEWSEVPGATYSIALTSFDGTTRTADTDETMQHAFGDLPAGEYTATVTALNPATGLELAATVNHYVGGNRIVFRSEVPLDRAMDVWGTGDVAVIGGGTNLSTSALVVNVSDPLNPRVLHTMEGIGFVRDIKVFDDLLFTAVDPDSDGCELCDDIGVRIYEFSEPSNPKLLSTIGSPAWAVHNMTYSNGYLYLASMAEGAVAIIDVRDPDTPQRVATWYANETPGPAHGPGGSTHDMTAQGDRLYVAHVTGFSIVDISDPVNPVTLSNTRVEMGMHNVWPNADGTRMVGTQEIFGGALTLWDIADPNAIELLDSRSTGDDRSVHNGYFDGETVFASWYIDGVFSFSVEDDMLTETGHYDTYAGSPPIPPDGTPPPGPPIEGAWGLWTYGDHVIVGDTERGMVIVDHFPRVVERTGYR